MATTPKIDGKVGAAVAALLVAVAAWITANTAPDVVVNRVIIGLDTTVYHCAVDTGPPVPTARTFIVTDSAGVVRRCAIPT